MYNIFENQLGSPRGHHEEAIIIILQSYFHFHIFIHSMKFVI